MTDLVERMTKILQRSDPLAGQLVARAAIAAVLDDMDERASEMPPSWPGVIHEFTADIRAELGLSIPEKPAQSDQDSYASPRTETI